MGDPWFANKSSVSFRFNFNWCVVVQCIEVFTSFCLIQGLAPIQFWTDHF